MAAGGCSDSRHALNNVWDEFDYHMEMRPEKDTFNFWTLWVVYVKVYLQPCILKCPVSFYVYYFKKSSFLKLDDSFWYTLHTKWNIKCSIFIYTLFSWSLMQISNQQLDAFRHVHVVSHSCCQMGWQQQPETCDLLVHTQTSLHFTEIGWKKNLLSPTSSKRLVKQSTSGMWWNHIIA